MARIRTKAVHILISLLGDVPLRVVESVIGKPATMLFLLDERYASTRAASRISLMTELYRSKFTRGFILKHCDCMASILSQLEKMGSEISLP